MALDFTEIFKSNFSLFFDEDDLTRNFSYIESLPAEVVLCSLKIKDDMILAGLPFFFEEAIISAIDLGKKGTDLIEDKNNDVSEELCKRYGLNFNKWKQTKINDFYKENGNSN